MDINQQLSTHYKLKDLIGTSTGISNIPSAAYLPNLKALAKVLELLREIGPFTIISGFRSPAVNAAVGGADQSYHSEGLAADIVPTSMSPRDFWNYIHNNPRYRNAVGEYALKEAKGNVHVSTPTPSKVAVPLYETNGVYSRVSVAFNEAYKLASANKYLILGGLGVGLIGLAVFLRRKYAQPQ